MNYERINQVGFVLIGGIILTICIFYIFLYFLENKYKNNPDKNLIISDILKDFYQKYLKLHFFFAIAIMAIFIPILEYFKIDAFGVFLLHTCLISIVPVYLFVLIYGLKYLEKHLKIIEKLKEENKWLFIF